MFTKILTFISGGTLAFIIGVKTTRITAQFGKPVAYSLKVLILVSMYSILKYACKESTVYSMLGSMALAINHYLGSKLNMIGLTGGIGCGKSTVVNIIKQEFDKNFAIIDCDLIARDVVRPGRYAYNRIVAHFGNGVVNLDGTINRKALGDKIFNDRTERKKLDFIIQPVIMYEILKQIISYRLKGYEHILLDAPLLYETKVLEHFCFPVIVLHVQNEDLWLERLMKRDTISKLEAKTKIECQMSISQKVRRADIVLNNSESVSVLAEKVRVILSKFI